MAGKRTRHRRRERRSDPNGNAPDRCELALVLIDVINDFEFPGGAQLYRAARRTARPLARLKARAARNGVPCIYVNDNFGRWRSDFAAQVRHCTRDGSRGRALVELLAPSARDYFVLKPRHSAFYQTCLALLLEHLGAKVLVIAGFATDSCVSMTASDAYLRDYSVVIVRDATAARTQRAHSAALAYMRTALRARTPKSASVEFGQRARGDTRRLSGKMITAVSPNATAAFRIESKSLGVSMVDLASDAREGITGSPVKNVRQIVARPCRGLREKS